MAHWQLPVWNYDILLSNYFVTDSYSYKSIINKYVSSARRGSFFPGFATIFLQYNSYYGQVLVKTLEGRNIKATATFPKDVFQAKSRFLFPGF